MNQPNSEIINNIKQASEGLLCMSESDYPFEVFVWEGIAPATPEKVVKKTNHAPNTSVQVVSVDDFFAVATQAEDWHGAEEQETVQKFQNLVQVIKSNLHNPQVYRLNNSEIDVYILGTTPSSDLAGLATKVVET